MTVPLLNYCLLNFLLFGGDNNEWKLQVLLVLGAAGGVGLSAVQIGKVCGAIVIAVARFFFEI